MEKSFFEENNLELIPCTDLEIVKYPDITTGYDFTVQDYSTFTTDDGTFLFDTVALYTPISKESQNEVKEKIFTIYSNESLGSVNYSLSKEMLIGLFSLTYIENKTPVKTLVNLQDVKDMHAGDRVNVNYKGFRGETTAGIVIFNTLLPDGYPFVNKKGIGKKDISEIMKTISEKGTQNEFVTTIDKIMKAGFYYSTIYPQSISYDMFDMPANIMQLKGKLAKEKDLQTQLDIIDEMEKELVDHLQKKAPELYHIIASGGSKGVGSFRQILVAKGVVSDSFGNILPPITNSMAEGFTPESYFDASAAARKGTMDRALNTAKGGYGYRKVVFAVANVETNPQNVNCGTKLTLNLKLTKDLYKRMGGRFIQTPSGDLYPVTENMIGSIINLRSPVYCRSSAICRTCYGPMISQINSKNAGVIAAQEVASLSEKIMKCSVGYIQEGDSFVWFDDFFRNKREEINFERIHNFEYETKSISTTLAGKQKKVSCHKVQRHKTDNKMILIQTSSGNVVFVQEDHPMFVKKNRLHVTIPNKETILAGDQEYYGAETHNQIGGHKLYTRKFYNICDEVKEVTAKNIDRNNDLLWIDNTPLFEHNENRLGKVRNDELFYLLGAYAVNGIPMNLPDDHHQYGYYIPWNKAEEDIKTKIARSRRRKIMNEDGFVFRSQNKAFDDIVLGEVGDWDRRIHGDILKLSPEKLRHFLAGFVDFNCQVTEHKVAGNKADPSKNYLTVIYHITKSMAMVSLLSLIAKKLGFIFEVNKYVEEKAGLRVDVMMKFGKNTKMIPSKRLEALGRIQRRGEISSYKASAIRGFDRIGKFYTIEKWDHYVYDVKTSSRDYMMNCVQNHNSFHCIKKEQTLYIKENNEYKLTTFEKLWNRRSESIIINEDQEEKHLTDVFVYDKEGFVKVEKIIRHKKQDGTKMEMIRSNNGDFVISQDNHPHMLATNKNMCSCGEAPLYRPRKEKNYTCLCGKEKNWRTKQESDDNFNMVSSKNFIKSKYFSYNDFPIWQNESKDPIMEPYLLGFFIAEGSFVKNNNKTEGDYYGFRYSQTEGTPEYKKALKLLKEQNYDVRTTVKTINVYEKELANKLLENVGEYCYRKSLPEDFIYYRDEDLAKILCGFIDGDGSFIKSGIDKSYISMESTSLEFIQQLHHILNKFNIKHGVTLSSIKSLTRNQSYIVKIYPESKDMELLKYSVKIDKEDIRESISNKNTNPSLINYCKEIMFDEDEYVYDLTTETGTLMCNGMWTHNTGAAVTLDRLDMIKEFMKFTDDKHTSYVKERLEQVKNELITRADFTQVIIHKNAFKNKFKIKKEYQNIMLPSGYFDMVIDDLKMEIGTENIVKLYTDKVEVEENDEQIIIVYPKGEKILEIKPVYLDAVARANLLDTLFGGRSPWNSPEQLYMKIYDMLGGLANWDSVHLEVILSNILRNKHDTRYPARLLLPYEPITLGIKELPGVISYPLGLGLENFQKSVGVGLYSDRGTISDIEKVLFGEPLVDPKKYKKN